MYRGTCDDCPRCTEMDYCDSCLGEMMARDRKVKPTEPHIVGWQFTFDNGVVAVIRNAQEAEEVRRHLGSGEREREMLSDGTTRP